MESSSANSSSVALNRSPDSPFNTAVLQNGIESHFEFAEYWTVNGNPIVLSESYVKLKNCRGPNGMHGGMTRRQAIISPASYSIQPHEPGEW